MYVKNILIQFKLTETSREKLRIMADSDSRSVSNYVQVLIEKHVKNVQLPCPVNKPLAPELPTDDSADVVVPAQSFPSRLAPVSCRPDPAPCVYTDLYDVAKCELEYAAWKRQNEKP